MDPGLVRKLRTIISRCILINSEDVWRMCAEKETPTEEQACLVRGQRWIAWDKRQKWMNLEPGTQIHAHGHGYWQIHDYKLHL